MRWSLLFLSVGLMPALASCASNARVESGQKPSPWHAQFYRPEAPEAPDAVLKDVPKRLENLKLGLSRDEVFRQLGLGSYRVEFVSGDGGGPTDGQWLREDYSLRAGVMPRSVAGDNTVSMSGGYSEFKLVLLVYPADLSSGFGPQGSRKDLVSKVRLEGNGWKKFQ